MVSVCSSGRSVSRVFLACALLVSLFAFSPEAQAFAPVAEDGHADHVAGHDTGVPMDFKADLALWSFVVFLLFLGAMGKFAWKPLIEGLDKRESGILAAIHEAEQKQLKAQEVLAEYEERLKQAEQQVVEIVAEAKRDAERTAADIVAAAEARVTEMQDRATDQIERARDAALADVFKQVNGQVVAATERVLGRALDKADQDRLVSEALSQLSS
jgi:F-type H+-transporting ATPase subunit b